MQTTTGIKGEGEQKNMYMKSGMTSTRPKIINHRYNPLQQSDQWLELSEIDLERSATGGTPSVLIVTGAT